MSRMCLSESSSNAPAYRKASRRYFVQFPSGSQSLRLKTLNLTVHRPEYLSANLSLPNDSCPVPRSKSGTSLLLLGGEPKVFFSNWLLTPDLMVLGIPALYPFLLVMVLRSFSFIQTFQPKPEDPKVEPLFHCHGSSHVPCDQLQANGPRSEAFRQCDPGHGESRWT